MWYKNYVLVDPYGKTCTNEVPMKNKKRYYTEYTNKVQNYINKVQIRTNATSDNHLPAYKYGLTLTLRNCRWWGVVWVWVGDFGGV